MNASTMTRTSATTRSARPRQVPLSGIDTGDTATLRSLARVARVSGGSTARGMTFNSSL